MAKSLLFTDVGQSCPSREFLKYNVTNMSLNDFCENKIHAKISELQYSLINLMLIIQ